MVESSSTHDVADAPAIGKLDADRVCMQCLHQLGGATIYRDTRLQIMYVRCTECGTIATVTEYPMSWRWLRRFGVIVAAAVLFTCFAVLAVDVAAATISTYAVSWDTARTFEPRLSAMGIAIDPQARWQAPAQLIGDKAALGALGQDPSLLDLAWKRWTSEMIPLAIAWIIPGVAWSLLLLHRRLIFVLAWQLVPITLAVLCFALVFTVEAVTAHNWKSYSALAYEWYGLQFAGTAFGIGVAVRLLTIVVTRPLARLMVTLLLPLRIRQAVASVWEADSISR